MDTTLDNVEFLARSRHRVAALETLIEESHDRAELRDSIGASSSTVGRVLNDLTEKGWITRHDHRYEATPVGQLVGTELTHLLDTMEAAEHLNEVVGWLPTEEMAFELGALDDAETTVPTRSNPFAPVNRMTERIESADRVRILAHAVTTLPLGTDRAGSTDGEFDAVVTPDLLDALAADTRLADQARTLFEPDGAALFRHDGELPYNLAVADDTVVFVGMDDQQHLPQGLVESEDRRVLSWAESVYESYRRDVMCVDLDELVA